MNPSATPTTANQPRVGRIQRGWEITKSSWQVLKLDKELAGIPVISTIVSMVAFIPFLILFVWLSDFGTAVDIASGATETQTSIDQWQLFAIFAGVMVVMTIIANFFAGALIHGAVERFRGGDPTIRSSLAGAKRKFRPLLGFSLMMATVGIILQLLEERLPIAGRIAAYLFDAAWNIANIFAIPVIVLSEENVSPLQATRQSVGVIKKVWGEGIVANLGIGLVGLSVIMLYLVSLGAITAIAVAAIAGITGSVPGAVWLALPIGAAVIGLILIGVILSAISAIAKAALYIYATTGEAPGTFKRELLEASITRKKARKVFA